MLRIAERTILDLNLRFEQVSCASSAGCNIQK